MKSRPIILFVCLAFLFGIFTTAMAEQEATDAELMAANVTYPVEGGLLYFDATTGTIESCNKTVTSADIPEAIYGIPVTKIAAFAFERCAVLTNVTIPDSITSLDVSAFGYCTALTDFTFPNGLQNISGSCFRGCTGLTSVIIPKTVKSIGGWAFDSCSSLKDVYYEGTLQDWLSISIETGNAPLISANIHFESEIPVTITESVRINSVEILDTSGKTLDAIPAGSFLASVSVTSLSSLDNALVFFAAYTSEGQFVNMVYAFVEASPGATVKVTLPFDNTAGKIAQVKAIPVTSYNMAPLASSVSFPVS